MQPLRLEATFDSIIMTVFNVFEEDASTHIVVRMALVWHCSPSPWTAKFENARSCAQWGNARQRITVDNEAVPGREAHLR